MKRILFCFLKEAEFLENRKNNTMFYNDERIYSLFHSKLYLKTLKKQIDLT